MGNLITDEIKVRTLVAIIALINAVALLINYVVNNNILTQCKP